MPLAYPNGGVPSLSLDYLQALRHELRFRRVPFLFLILRLFLIIAHVPSITDTEGSTSLSAYRGKSPQLHVSFLHFKGSGRGLYRLGQIQRKC